MTEKQIIREILSLRRWSQQKLAEESGFKSQSNINGLLNATSKGIRIDTFLKILDATGCELIVRDKMGSKKEWVVDTQTASASAPKSLEEQLLAGEITFDQAVKQGWKPSPEMLSRMLGEQ